MNRLFGTTLVSAFLAASASSMAIAQTPSGPTSPPAAGSAQKFSERPFSRPTERVEARLAYLKTALKISAAQQAQWDAYADVVRKNAKEMEQRLQSRQSGQAGHPGHKPPTAIERLEREQAFHAEAVTRINQLLAVQKPLYAALSPEQQKIADVVLSRRGGPMEGARPMDGPRMHGHGGGFGRD